MDAPNINIDGISQSISLYAHISWINLWLYIDFLRFDLRFYQVWNWILFLVKIKFGSKPEKKSGFETQFKPWKTWFEPWKNSVWTIKKSVWELKNEPHNLKNSGSNPEKDFKPEKIMVLKIARVLKSRFTGRD